MGGNTGQPWTIPYPTGTDLVANGDNAIEALARDVHADLDTLAGRISANSAAIAALPPIPPAIDVNTPYVPGTLQGWTGSLGSVLRAGWVFVYIQAYRNTWAVNSNLGNINAAHTPAWPIQAVGVQLSSGALSGIGIDTSGHLLAYTQSMPVNGVGGGIGGFIMYPKM